MRDKPGSAVQTYPADRLGEDGADVHDLELSVGLLEVLGLRDRVGDLRRLKCELSGCCAQSSNRGKKKAGRLTTTLVRGILDNSCRLSPERRPVVEKTERQKMHQSGRRTTQDRDGGLNAPCETRA